MLARIAVFAGLSLGMILAFCWNQAHAVIKADTPLSAIERNAQFILVGKVEKFFPDKPALLVTVSEQIKGKAPFVKLPINCKVANEKLAKTNQIEPLMKRFGPEQEIIFFVAAPRAKNLITFAFTNGTWFQLQGTQVGDKNEVVFSLVSAEPYFRKSFKGTTEELRNLLKDFAAGKAKLPAIDDKTEPGFGPEYAPKQKSERSQEIPPLTPNPSPTRGEGSLTVPALIFARPSIYGSEGTLFGVIPTIGLGAPLAILALLFPTIFGGVFVLFRQWLAFITLISLNSTLTIGHWLLSEYHPALLRATWWSSPAALWFLMTMFTFVCAFWAWRRQLNALSDGEPEAPRKTELLVLSFMTLSCAATTIVLWCLTKNILWASDIGWTLTVVMTPAVLAGTLYKAWHAWKKPSPFGSMPLTTEGVILSAMLLGHLVFVPVILGGINTAGSVIDNAATGSLSTKVAPVVKKWEFVVPENGMFASSPIVEGEAIYASYSNPALRVATMVRLERQTGMKKWEFIGKDGKLIQMISTPCFADGKLYFGEGFHDDPNCKVYCVDAENGEELWRFQTEGQTESSPTVANGKVYIGAGNVGVYCLDAKKGTEIWKFPPDDYKGRLLRFCGGMSVVGDRLYFGSGVDRNVKSGDKGETASFCVDAGTGKLIWKTPAPFAVWSTPVVKDAVVYVASGNGDVFEDTKDADGPGGTLQCLDLKTGQEKWRVKTNNGIIESPVVDAHRVYFGCRDGQVYCLNRTDGAEKWRRFLDLSPVIATPVLDSDPVLERTVSVFAASIGGKVCCLNPQTGEIVWTYDLTQQNAYIATSPRLRVTATPDGYRRQLYFGAGIGGGLRDPSSNRPVFYCLEDRVKVE